MSTYTQILYQIVFCTKYTKPTLQKTNRVRLFAYIYGIIINKKCFPYQINGVADHIHIATHLHPGTSLASLVRDIKVSSSIWIKKEGIFPNFSGWQGGYGAFTYSISAKQNLINYIRNQEIHHRETSFREEYVKLLREYDVDYDERYLL